MGLGGLLGCSMGFGWVGVVGMSCGEICYTDKYLLILTSNVLNKFKIKLLVNPSLLLLIAAAACNAMKTVRSVRKGNILFTSNRRGYL